MSPPGVEKRRPQPRQMRRAPPSGTRGGRSAAPGAQAGGPPQAGDREAGGAGATAHRAAKPSGSPSRAAGAAQRGGATGEGGNRAADCHARAYRVSREQAERRSGSRGGWPTGANAPGVPGASPGTVQLRPSEEIPRGEGRSGPWRGGTTTLLSPLVVVGHWSKCTDRQATKRGVDIVSPSC